MSNNGHSKNRGTAKGSAEQVYGRALLEIATGAGAVPEVAAQAQEILDLVQSNADLRLLLTSRALSEADRAASLERIFRDRVHPSLYNFLQVVNSKGRLAELGAILRAFAALVGESQGIVEVDVFVPAPMIAADLDALARRIGHTLGRQVVLHAYVEPAMVGGLKLRVGDQLIDGSLATQLKLLRQRMVEAGRERARTGSIIENA